MKEKINLQELTALLSDKAGISKKDADVFLREFFGLMTESIAEDKIVKVRSLGTFKLTEVEARESVNVRTGERFLIAAHSRISFSPDKTLSEIINKPYEHLVSEPITENVEKTGKVKTVEKAGKTKEEKKAKETEEIKETKKAKKPETITRKKKVVDKTPQIVESKPITKKSKVIDTVHIEKDTPLENNLPNIEKENDSYDDYFSDKGSKIINPDELGEETIRSRKRKIRTIIFTFLAVGVLIGFFYYYLSESTESPFQSAPDRKIPLLGTLIEDKLNTEPALIIRDTSVIISDPAKEDAAPIDSTWAPGKKRKTKVGERLTLISFEEYGDVVFWIYIYEENKHLISKDNYVKAGVEITIPTPEKYDIDATDQKSLQKARDFNKKLQSQQPKRLAD